jgi:hypothetical protein
MSKTKPEKSQSLAEAFYLIFEGSGRVKLKEIKVN